MICQFIHVWKILHTHNYIVISMHIWSVWKICFSKQTSRGHACIHECRVQQKVNHQRQAHSIHNYVMKWVFGNKIPQPPYASIENHLQLSSLCSAAEKYMLWIIIHTAWLHSKKEKVQISTLESESSLRNWSQTETGLLSTHSDWSIY